MSKRARDYKKFQRTIKRFWLDVTRPTSPGPVLHLSNNLTIYFDPSCFDNSNGIHGLNAFEPLYYAIPITLTKDT